MKKLNEVYDFKKVPVSEKLLEIKVPNARIDEILQNTRERFLTIEQVYDGIIKGDFAAIEMDDSSEGDGKKRIQINVGKNIFNKQFELDLLGMKKDDVKPIGFNDNTVNVKVISVKRRMVTPLTDELVCRLGIEGLTTADAYRNYIFNNIADRIKEKKSQALVDYVIKQVVAKTEFNGVNKNDKVAELYLNINKQRIKSAAESKGVSFNEMLISWLGKETAEEAMKTLSDMVINDAKNYYVGCFYADKNQVEFTEKESKEKIRKMAMEYGMPYEEAIKQMPVELDIMESYKGYYENIINDYYKGMFKVSLA